MSAGSTGFASWPGLPAAKWNRTALRRGRRVHASGPEVVVGGELATPVVDDHAVPRRGPVDLGRGVPLEVDIESFGSDPDALDSVLVSTGRTCTSASI